MEASIAEAKKRFCELVDVAEKGGTVVILRHGRPAAQLTPVPMERKRQPVAHDDPKLYRGINLNEPILDEI